MAADCIEQKANLSKSKCKDLPELPKGMFTVPSDFELTEEQLATPASLKTALQTALKASRDERIYKWPNFSNAEDNSEGTVYVESAFGTRKSRDGNYRFRFFISKSLCLHKKMFTHGAIDDGRVIPYDSKRRILLTKLSNGNYTGLSIDCLNPEKLKINMGDVITESPIYVALQDNLEIDQDGYLFDIGSIWKELVPLTDVTLTVNVIDSDNFTVTVTQSCDGTPVSGLADADWVITTSGVPDSITEPASDGVYLFTRAANFVDGTVDLVDASLLSLDAYENPDGPATVNIP